MKKDFDEQEEFVTVDPETVTLAFLQNRSYELHIGDKTYPFAPYESVPVPKYVVEHSDFKSVESYFHVKR